MRLIVAHQILIGAAIAMAILFGARALVHAARGDGTNEAIIGVASLVAAALLGVYLRKVRRQADAERRS